MRILSVIRNQWKRFVTEKGMLFFYTISILLVGIIIPYYVRNFQISFSIIAVLTIMVSKPILADSVASEREKKILESILSSSITIREYMIGKVTFCLLFSMVFFALCNILFVIACKIFRISNISSEFVTVEWYHSVIIVLLLTTISGVYKSAKSENMHIAQNKCY